MRTIVLIALACLSFSYVPNQDDSVCLSTEERKLYDILNQYRRTKGLKAIPLSSKLSKVAQTHAHDLMDNYTFDFKNECNPHSWSSNGAWTPCCYTSDHKQAKCMWDKPREIAQYAGNGYEIAYWTSGAATADEALAGWKVSPGHNPLIINDGIWKKSDWKGIGIGIFGNYGVVWFGEVSDETRPGVCQ